MNNMNKKYDAIRVFVNNRGLAWWLAPFNLETGSLIREMGYKPTHTAWIEKVRAWEEFVPLEQLCATQEMYLGDTEFEIEEAISISAITPQMKGCGYRGPGIYCLDEVHPGNEHHQFQVEEGIIPTLLEQGQLELSLEPAEFVRVPAEGGTGMVTVSRQATSNSLPTKRQEKEVSMDTKKKGMTRKMASRVIGFFHKEEAPRLHWDGCMLSEQVRETSKRSYDGTVAPIYGPDGIALPGEETTLHGMYEAMLNDGLLAIVKVDLAYGAQFESYVANVKDAWRGLQGVWGSLYMLPSTVEKARSKGLVYFFKGSVAAMKEYFLVKFGIGLTEDDLLFFQESPEKAAKAMSDKVDKDRIGSTLIHVCDVDWDAATERLREMYPKSMGAVNKLSADQFDGVQFMSTNHPLAKEWGLKVGDGFQTRAKAKGETLIYVKGITWVIKAADMLLIAKIFGHEGDIVNTIISLPEVAKRAEAGTTLWTESFGIHKMWNDHFRNNRRMSMGNQTVRNLALGNTEMAIYREAKANYSRLNDAIVAGCEAHDIEPLREYLDKHVLVEDIDDADKHLDVMMRIGLGRPWLECAADKTFWELLGKLVADAPKTIVPAQRAFNAPIALYWIITGNGDTDMSVVLAPETRDEDVPMGVGPVLALRNPNLSWMGVSVLNPIRDEDWYIHGHAVDYGCDNKGRLICGLPNQSDFDGDMIGVASMAIIGLAIDPMEYRDRLKAEMTQYLDWAEGGEKIEELPVPTRTMPEGMSPRERGLWLGFNAYMGIPVADSSATIQTLNNQLMGWQEMAAYQSIVKLIKHQGTGLIVDVDALNKATPRSFQSRIFSILKRGGSVKEMAEDMAGNLEDYQAGDLKSHPIRNQFFRDYTEMFFHTLTGHVAEFVEVDGIQYPEYVQKVNAEGGINRALAFMFGIKNTEPHHFISGNSKPWNLRKEDTIMGVLHAEIAAMIAAKNGKKLDRYVADGRPMAAHKAEVRERIMGLLGWHMSVRLQLALKPEALEKDVMYWVRAAYKRMGMTVSEHSFGNKKLGMYRAEFVRLLGMTTNEFAAEIGKLLFYSYAKSDGMSSNLWFLGAKLVAHLLGEAGQPVVKVKGSKPEPPNGPSHSQKKLEEGDASKETTLIVSGSRSITDADAVEAELDKSCQIAAAAGKPINAVVVGDAKGVDTIAAEWAKKRGLHLRVFKAKWNDLSHKDARIKTNRSGKQYDANAGHRRNGWMLNHGDRVLVIWDGKSPGTNDMITKAKELGKMVKVIIPALTEDDDPRSESGPNAMLERIARDELRRGQ